MGGGSLRDSQDKGVDGAEYYRCYSTRYSKDRLGDCKVSKQSLSKCGQRGKGTAVS